MDKIRFKGIFQGAFFGEILAYDEETALDYLAEAVMDKHPEYPESYICANIEVIAPKWSKK